MTRVTFRPIDQWPGKLRSEGERRYSQFSAPYRTTLEALDRELGHLGATQVVLQCALDQSQIRLDGLPRSGAIPVHPGVILAFDSNFGPLKYATDVFTGRGDQGWQANLRAITLGLEALRRVDRYGITKRGEQYTGWAALPPGQSAIAMGSGITLEEAAVFVAAASGDPSYAEDLLSDLPLAEALYRDAAKQLHPDAGGDHDAFARLQDAMAVIRAAA